MVGLWTPPRDPTMASGIPALNTGHPLAQGLQSALRFDNGLVTPIDAVSRVKWSAVATPASRGGRTGQGAYYSGSAGHNTTDITVSLTQTICVVVRPTARNFTYFFGSNDASATITWACWIDSSAILHWQLGTPTSSQVTYTLPTGWEDDWHAIVCTTGARGTELYIDGVRRGSLATVPTGAPTTAGFKVGRWSTGAGAHYTSLLLVWDRQLSEQAAIQASLEPFAVFSAPSPLWLPGPGAVTLTPSPVAVAATLPAPAVSLSAVSLTPSPAALSVTLPAPTVSLGAVSLTPDPVALSLTLPAPAITLGLNINPNPVAISATLPAPTVSLSAVSLTPDPVGVSATLPAPSVSLGAVTLTPSPVAPTFTLPAPTITLSAVTLTPSPVVLAVTLPAPSVATVITPAPVTPTFTLPAPTVTVSAVSLTPSPVALSVTLPAPTVSAGGTITTYIEIDWNNDGDFADAYDDISADVISWESSRGRSTPTMVPGGGDVPAGRLTLRLYNLDGKYSSLNASSPLSGSIKPGRPVRVRLSGAYTGTIWYGYLDRVVPDAVAAGSVPTATLTALGPLIKVSDAPKTSAPPMSSAATGAIIEAILDAANYSATLRDIEAGQTTVNEWYAFDVTPIEALRDVDDTELGFLHESADGKIVWHDRHHRHLTARSTTPQATFADNSGTHLLMTGISQADTLDAIINSVSVTYTLLTESGNEVLWTQPTGLNPIYGVQSPWEWIPPGTAKTWVATAPDDVLYVKTWVDFDFTSDWTHWAPFALDIVQAYIDIATSADPAEPLSAASAKHRLVRVTNNYGAFIGVKELSVSGAPVRESTSTVAMSYDSTSVTAYGKRGLSSDVQVRFLPSEAHAQDYADYLVYRYKDPIAALTLDTTATFDPDHAAGIFGLELADRITVTATGASQLGYSGDYYVESVAFRGHDIHVDATLGLSAVMDAVWILGTSELGTDTRLTY